MATSVSNVSSEKEQMIAANINLYLFQNVWNETQRSLRNNILPQLLNTRTYNGSVMLYGNSTPLPNDTDSFYLFAIARSAAPGLQWPKRLVNAWISTQDLINEDNILLDTYHIHGKMLNKKDVYVYKLPNEYGFIVAVNKRMSSKIVPHTEMANIRFTVYYDPDMLNQIYVTGYTVPTTDGSFSIRSEIWNKYQSYKTVPVGTNVPTVLMFINGVETVPVDMASIPTGSVVDIHADYNVTCDITIDLSNPVLNAAFFSDMDKVYKQIVHIPKLNNPNHYVMTHNAMEIYVRKRNPEADGTYQGLYLHRCAERSVTQITHQDIGIPLYILDAYRDYLGTSEIVLHLYWRQHDAPNTLIRDKNYIDLLYYNSHIDQEIIGYLSGQHQWSEALPFWKASNLEQSEYIKMFFDVPDTVTPSNMTYYIEALGYYNVMCLLCKHIYKTKITDWYQGGYSFPKPLVYQGSPVAALIYGDGKKLPEAQVKVKNDDDFYATIAVPTSTPIGTDITVEMYLDGNKKVYGITPDVGSTLLVIPPTEYIIVEEVDCPVETNKYDQTSTKGYVEFTKFAGNIVKTTLPDGSYQLSFGPSMFGRRFFIMPKPRVRYWSTTDNPEDFDIQTKMENGDPLFFPLRTKVGYRFVNNVLTYVDEYIPEWETSSMLVFLNGRYLIRDLDYTIQDVKNYNGQTAMKILVIQNLSYLETTGNNLEVYSTSASIENCERGYVSDRRDLDALTGGTELDDAPIITAGVMTDNRTFIYNASTTMIHVNGYFSPATIHGNSLSMDPTWLRPWSTGQAIEVKTAVPYFISDYLKKYHSNDDFERIELLNKYFYNRDLRLPSKIVINQSHLLYSVYTATVLRDVLQKKNLQLSLDPDTRRMYDQLTSYAYLKDMDVVTNVKIDLTYVDGYPHYKQLIAPDKVTYDLLYALMKITMPADDIISDKKDINLVSP